MRARNACLHRAQPALSSSNGSRWRAYFLLVLAGAFVATFLAQRPAQAGGPLIVGGLAPTVDAQPFTWSTTTEVQYRTDGGFLGVRDNTTANNGVIGMFDVWENVTTATIAFNRAGALQSTGAFTDGDVSDTAEFDAVQATCGTLQNPIIYDVNGSLFTALGSDTNVIGFAGACQIAVVGGVNRITGATAALNGKFRDNIPDTDMDGENDELTDNEFDAVFIHEFGHFFGMDHSQINVNCLTMGCADGSDDAFGLPTMFPILLSGLQETAGVHPARTLSMDDIAWVSRLYPDATFNLATISGTIFFSDGITHAQGVNVIARQVDDPATVGIDESRRNAVSVVSGYLYTGNPGQSITANYLPCSPPSGCPPSGFADDNTGGSTFGSRDVTRIGAYDIPVPATPLGYTVQVESVNAAFVAGSSVGPLDLPIPNPGDNEFFSGPPDTNSDGAAPAAIVPVAPSVVTSGIDIILNNTDPRFDSFESARLWLPEPQPAWIRREILLPEVVLG